MTHRCLCRPRPTQRLGSDAVLSTDGDVMSTGCNWGTQGCGGDRFPNNVIPYSVMKAQRKVVLDFWLLGDADQVGLLSCV